MNYNKLQKIYMIKRSSKTRKKTGDWLWVLVKLYLEIFFLLNKTFLEIALLYILEV